MYFNTCSTVEETKALYRKLAMQNHPDKGGNTATMQAINAEYHAKLKRFDKTTSTDKEGYERTYYYNQASEQEIIDKLDEMIAASYPDWEILLIGKWIWIDGTKREQKDKLGKNGLGCFWHSKRSMWYWKPSDSKRSRFNSRASLADIAQTYGYQKFAGKAYADEQQDKQKRRSKRLAA